MSQFNGAQQLGEAVVGLIMLPFMLARGLFRLRQHWRRYVPLHIKNQVRSGAGAAGLALCASFSSWLLALPNGSMILFGASALSLLYLLGGALSAMLGARFDWFSAFWFAVAGLACGVFLIFGEIPDLSWTGLN